MSKVRDFRENFHVVVTQEKMESYFFFETPWSNHSLVPFNSPISDELTQSHPLKPIPKL